MYRIRPTGNATFDAVEDAAYADFLQTGGEVGYLATCWWSAITQYEARVLNHGATTISLPRSTPVPLSWLSKNLATQLRTRGVILPSHVFLAQSAVVASGGATNMAVVGDVLTLTTGATIQGQPRVVATFTVATVDAGPLPATVAIRTSGLYTTMPTGAVATTVDTAAYADCTLTVLWYPRVVTYNS